ncbi:V-type proton ATPase subunit H [Acorus gramineus]|uniref:V-type proton ATPase subunit H n=1 Tax=Acorus gramineus TaxID=55184 RepID=A0AAV9AY11_ACOGR|nr:V-type proton ATPase subunit H [Acorus gramineus]
MIDLILKKNSEKKLLDGFKDFEENDFQILCVLITVIDAMSRPRTLAVTFFDLSQFIQYHPAGWIIVADPKE